MSLAAHLQSRGIQPGDKVALMCGNRPEFTISYYGILAAGAIVVSLNNLLVADEIVYQLENSESVAVLSDDECLEDVLEAVERVSRSQWVLLADLSTPTGLAKSEGIPAIGKAIEDTSPLEFHVARQPHDTAVVMYTSGTTGFPKGAELTHFNLWENARQVAERLFSRDERGCYLVSPGDVAIAVLPLYHSFGQTCVQNTVLYGGGAITYQKRFDANETARIIHRDRVTILHAVPTIYNGLINLRESDLEVLETLKFGISGGSALPLEVREAFEEQSGMRMQEGYGLTETSPVASVQRLYRKRKNGSVGNPLLGCKMKIADENDQEVPPGTRGEVLIRGRNVMKGYLNNPDATEEAMRGGWFHTEDVGIMDEDGDFYIVDRTKDMILRGGFNVYPREVEEVLYRHPAILEASIIGVPDKHYGEEVKAVVSLKEGASIGAEEIIAYCKEHVAAYKYPRSVEMVDELPKGPTGKILKREIRQLYGSTRQPEGRTPTK